MFRRVAFATMLAGVTLLNTGCDVGGEIAETIALALGIVDVWV